MPTLYFTDPNPTFTHTIIQTIYVDSSLTDVDLISTVFIPSGNLIAFGCLTSTDCLGSPADVS